jgi:hypothetical protein
VSGEPEAPPGLLADAMKEARTARLAFEAGSYVAAARGFMVSARLLAQAPPGAFAAELEAVRELAYKNAASAWSLSSDAAEGHAALERALRRDPACAPALADLVRQLDPSAD